MTITNKRTAEEVRAELRDLRLARGNGETGHDERITELSDSLSRYHARKAAARERRALLFEINGHHGPA